MKSHIKISAIILLLIISTSKVKAQEATKAHKDSLDAIITQYYTLNLKIFQANSSIEDINRTFELFTDDFTYIHPKYGGTYSREDLYNGYVRNQKNGRYDGKVTDIKIINKIIGLNAVVVQKMFVRKSGDAEPEMTLFDFKEGKIYRIFEYW